MLTGFLTDTVPTKRSGAIPERIKLIQTGSVAFTNAESTKTAAIVAVDETKAFIRFSVRLDNGAGADDPRNVCWTTQFNSSTQIQFDRAGANTAGTIEYEVVEFTAASGVSVQHISGSSSVTTLDIAISSVTESETFVFAYGRSNQGGLSEDDIYNYYLTGPTNVRFTWQAGPGAPYTIRAQVISGPDFSVQQIGPTTPSGSFTNVAISSAPLANSFALFAGNIFTGAGDLPPDEQGLAYLFDPTNLRFFQYANSSITADAYRAFVVTDNYPTASVQRGRPAIASGTGTQNIAVSAVNLAKTSLFISSFAQNFSPQDGTTRSDATGSSCMLTAKFTSTTNVQLQRNATSLNCTTSFKAISWE